MRTYDCLSFILPIGWRQDRRQRGKGEAEEAAVRGRTEKVAEETGSTRHEQSLTSRGRPYYGPEPTPSTVIVAVALPPQRDNFAPGVPSQHYAASASSGALNRDADGSPDLRSVVRALQLGGHVPTIASE